MLPLRFTCTLRITGAARSICTVLVGAGVGVISTPAATNRYEMLIVPETVPVCRATGVSGVVLPVGMVKFAVVPPDAN